MECKQILTNALKCRPIWAFANQQAAQKVGTTPFMILQIANRVNTNSLGRNSKTPICAPGRKLLCPIFLGKDAKEWGTQTMLWGSEGGKVRPKRAMSGQTKLSLCASCAFWKWKIIRLIRQNFPKTFNPFSAASAYSQALRNISPMASLNTTSDSLAKRDSDFAAMATLCQALICQKLVEHAWMPPCSDHSPDLQYVTQDLTGQCAIQVSALSGHREAD